MAGTGDIVQSLGSLVAKSLVQLVDDAGQLRYRLLETVRLYAEAKLVDSGEAGECRGRHRDWVLDWLESIPFEERWLGDVDYLTGEYPSVREALELSTAEGHTEAVARIASGVDWARSEAWKEGKRWCEEAVAAADLPPDLQTQLCVVLWRVMAMSLRGSTHWSARNSLAKRAIDASAGRPSPLHAVRAREPLPRRRCLGDGAQGQFARAPSDGMGGGRCCDDRAVSCAVADVLSACSRAARFTGSQPRRGSRAPNWRNTTTSLDSTTRREVRLTSAYAPVCADTSRSIGSCRAIRAALSQRLARRQSRTPVAALGMESSMALALVDSLGEAGDTDAARRELRDLRHRRPKRRLGARTARPSFSTAAF